MFSDLNHLAAFQRGMSVTDTNVHTHFERIYASNIDFPLIADNDPDRAAKQRTLDCLVQAHADYQGALPWILLNRMADALVNRSGASATIVSPQIVEADGDQALLLDAAIHALEATTRVNVDLMRRTSEAGGRIYSHSHDCNDCGIVANITIAPLTQNEISRFGGNYISQLCASLEAIRAGLPFKMLETCSGIPAGSMLH